MQECGPKSSISNYLGERRRSSARFEGGPVFLMYYRFCLLEMQLRERLAEEFRAAGAGVEMPGYDHVAATAAEPSAALILTGSG